MKSNFKIIYDIIIEHKRELKIVDEILIALENEDILFESLFKMLSTHEMLTDRDRILIRTTEGFVEVDRKEWITEKICELMLV